MTHSVAVFLFPGVRLLEFAATNAFDVVNALCQRQVYALSMYSAAGGAVRSGAGVSVDTRVYPEGGRGHDTLLAFGADRAVTVNGELAGVLRRAGMAARRSASIGSGAEALAATGLLDGLRVAVSEHDAAALQARYPAVRFDPGLAYVRDGRHWSCAGMSSAIDCVLALVAEDMGTEMALEVARSLVLYNWRCEAHAQRSTLLDMAPRSGRISQALSYARQNLRLQLTIDELAGRANMSARHFTRTFRAETGQSPARAIEAMRAEVARGLLEGSTLSLGSVARESGFTGPEQMRTALSRVYRQTPQALRGAVAA